MKTTTFTCTKSAEEISKSVHERSLMYKVLSWACLFAICPLFYISFFVSGTFDINAISLILFVIGVAAMLLCFFLFRKVLERLPDKYEIMPTKEFGWDETHNQFIYKDKDQTLRFKGDDIEKWVSYVNSKSGEPTEIILLHTGEKMILEGEWNMEVHNYLNLNRTALGLPKPHRWTWSFEIY